MSSRSDEEVEISLASEAASALFVGFLIIGVSGAVIGFLIGLLVGALVW